MSVESEFGKYFQLGVDYLKKSKISDRSYEPEYLHGCCKRCSEAYDRMKTMFETSKDQKEREALLQELKNLNTAISSANQNMPPHCNSWSSTSAFFQARDVLSATVEDVLTRCNFMGMKRSAQEEKNAQPVLRAYEVALSSQGMPSLLNADSTNTQENQEAPGTGMK